MAATSPPIQHPGVAEKFDSYPLAIRKKLLALRQLILQTAEAHKDVDTVDETLKWGEPSYLAKKGSTVRVGWSAKMPDQYALYFNCNTKLVDTFKELYGSQLEFSGNRAIVFSSSDKLPVKELKHCIALSLTYHKVKHLPLLGA